VDRPQHTVNNPPREEAQLSAITVVQCGSQALVILRMPMDVTADYADRLFSELKRQKDAGSIPDWVKVLVVEGVDVVVVADGGAAKP
jgi:hypothetical protein